MGWFKSSRKAEQELGAALRLLHGNIESIHPDNWDRTLPRSELAAKIAKHDTTCGLEGLIDHVVELAERMIADGKRVEAAACVDDAAREPVRVSAWGRGPADAAAARAEAERKGDPLLPVRQQRWEEAIQTVRERAGLSVTRPQPA